jgi:hypothetical protein
MRRLAALAQWGWGGAFVIVTHRPHDIPQDAGFTFVNGLGEAITDNF